MRIPHGIVSNPQRLTGAATVAAGLMSSGGRDNGIEGHAKMDLCDKGTIHQWEPHELVPRGLLMLCPINNLHNEGSLRFVKIFAKSESIRKAYCLSLLMGGISIAKSPSALSTSATMEPTYNSAESDYSFKSPSLHNFLGRGRPVAGRSALSSGLALKGF